MKKAGIPAPAARSRSTSVPCGTSSASTSPDSKYFEKAIVCDARVGAVNEQIIFRTWPFSTRMPTSGVPSGMPTPPPGRLETMVRLARALPRERRDQVARHAGGREPAAGDRRAVGNVRDRVVEP